MRIQKGEPAEPPAAHARRCAPTPGDLPQSRAGWAAAFWKPFVIGSMAVTLSGLLSSYSSLLKAGGLWLLFLLKERGLGPPRGQVKEGTHGHSTRHLAASSNAFKKGPGHTGQRIREARASPRPSCPRVPPSLLVSQAAAGPLGAGSEPG